MSSIADFFALNPSYYSISIEIFLRLLGVIYICAYFPFLFQMKGLFGKEGILPIATFLDRIKAHSGRSRYWHVPTLFWINASDKSLLTLIWVGLFLGLLVALGVHSPLIFLLLYLIHLSLTTAGQDFLSFGWETFLMEITVASFFMTLTAPYNVFGWLSLNFLLFRFYIQAGYSKIRSHDVNWRNFTAIAYHYLTQPIPNLTAWYFHKFPMWFHKFSVAVMFYAELIVPLFMFSPPWVRLIVFTQMFGLQWSIWLTGNLSYLNHMTMAVCVILIHNQFLESFFVLVVSEPSSLGWYLLVSIPALAFFLLQVACLIHTFSPSIWTYRALAAVERFHLAYPHGIFAVMTTKRIEIIIEGSSDGIEWKEYEFYHKPGSLTERPRRVSPYQPRIDWQAWFLPFGHHQNELWFQMFLYRILQGSKDVLKLLKVNPFKENPPEYIRALAYDYEYTTIEEKKLTNRYWKRTYVGIYANSIKLKEKK